MHKARVDSKLGLGGPPDFTATMSPNSLAALRQGFPSTRDNRANSISNNNSSLNNANASLLRGAAYNSVCSTTRDEHSGHLSPTFNTVESIDPNALREAVTTSRDQFSLFEEALLQEINLLRQNPKGYAVLFEAQATIGYPYVCPDDLYFESDERVTEQFAVKPPPKPPAPEKPTRGHKGDKDKDKDKDKEKDKDRRERDNATASSAGEGEDEINTPVHANEKKSHSRPHSAKSIEKEASFGFPLDQDREVHVKPPTTVRENGMTELNVEQLRTFFLRHQRHRMLLEKAVRDHLHLWQVADQQQHEAWAAEDAQAVKKIKRGGRKKSISNFASDDVTRQRSSMADQLSWRFMEKLRTLMRALCQSRDTCKRAMDGVNLMLDCIRALKEAKPVPLLRGSRGLKLAARDTGQFFHRNPEIIEQVFQAHQNAIECVCPSRLLPDRPEKTQQKVGSGGRFQEEQSMPLFDARSAADAMHYFEELWTPKQPKGTGLSGLTIGATVNIKEYISALADVTQRCCDEYGYVSGEVRGVQLYSNGTARTLVMKALLGVAVPVFGFRELQPTNQIHYGGGTGAIISSPLNKGSPGRSQGSVHSAQRGKGSPDREGTVKFDDSIFNFDTVDDGGSEDDHLVFDLTEQSDNSGFSPALLMNTASASLKTTTGLMFGGSFNATSPSAAKCINAEEISENTSAGRRAALAAQRLGPLLWRDAHLLGCGWQRVVPEKPVPSYDDREDGSIPTQQPHQEVVVSTTLVVASGYEELDLIEQHKHMSLAEVRRIVRYEEESRQQADGRGSVNAGGPLGEEISEEFVGSHSISAAAITTSTADRPAVVDLHSSLDVSLVYPKKHPVRVEQTMQTAWLALNADPHRVRIVATLTGAQEARPQCPIMNSSELLVQPSNRDPSIILILLNVAAAKAKTTDGKVLIHIFECDRRGGGETGFEHIGFVRLTLPFIANTSLADRSSVLTPSLPANSPKSGATHRLRSAISKSSQRSIGIVSNHSMGTAVTVPQLVTQGDLMTSTPAELLGLVADLRLSPHPSLARPLGDQGELAFPLSVGSALLPQISGGQRATNASNLHDVPGSVSKFDLAASPSSTSAIVQAIEKTQQSRPSEEVALYGSCGWPMCSFEFFDRCATLLGPLSGCLTNGSEVCRMSIFIPLCESYLKLQIESLEAIQQELEEKENEEADLPGADSETPEDEDYSLLENSLYRKFVLKELPSRPPTPPPPPPPEPAVVKGKGKAPAAKGKAAAPAVPAKIGKGARGISDTATSASHDKRGSVLTLDEAKREELLTLPPTSVDYYDPLRKVHLHRLHRLCDRLTQEAIVCRGMYVRAETILRPALADMDSEMEKKKGKEILKLKAEHEATSAGLEEMHKKVCQVEEVCMRVREEILSRQRNGVVRRARQQQIELELQQLMARADRHYPLSVKLWFTGGKTSAPLSTSRHDEGSTLPPIQLPPQPVTAAPLLGTPFDSTLAPSETHSPYLQQQFLESRGMPLNAVIGSGHVPPRDSNVIVLEPKDSLYTLYEAEFRVPEGFEGSAVLLINDQETITWKVTAGR